MIKITPILSDLFYDCPSLTCWLLKTHTVRFRGNFKSKENGGEFSEPINSK